MIVVEILTFLSASENFLSELLTLPDIWFEKLLKHHNFQSLLSQDLVYVILFPFLTTFQAHLFFVSENLFHSHYSYYNAL